MKKRTKNVIKSKKITLDYSIINLIEMYVIYFSSFIIHLKVIILIFQILLLIEYISFIGMNK